ncbi:hypothetical protein FKZ61_008360 [Litorilinea aerophila]|uniref:hypothetical protein n=1 Tax=Litorilinea aerophila TaxID=1204385 RepID=UPI001E45F206|nr:hypothetical protein [Litorilinea aerophila]MCC9076121.1 hypothetical protein [Litorilinea aerophila]GIV78820.1 MAG: hypothetical protein KatS3mg050_3214 [Litorilinea sp.]
MSGYEIVTITSSFHILPEPNVNYAFDRVRCPSGKKVVAGGYQLPSDQSLTGLEILPEGSYPDSDSSWQVRFRNQGSGIAQFDAILYAVCVFVE